jgi:dipeptidyl aminopeptidase/acylaminoacyl peptidase
MRNPINWPKLLTLVNLFPAVLLLLLVIGAAFAPNAAAQKDDADGPDLTVLVGALNVRSGPGVAYPVVDLLMQGDQVPVIGRHAGSGWWQVALPDEDTTGWVSGGAAYVAVDGDTRGVPETRAPVPSAAAVQSTALPSSSTRDTAGTIVFQTASGGPIYAVNADGTGLRYLTTGIDPALSPDGQWVTFTRWEDTQNGALGSLWVINVDGTGERQILGDIHQPKAPTWSPGGTQIAISMQHGGRVSEVRKCGTERPPQGAYDIEVRHDENGEIKFCYTLPPHPYYGLRVVDVATGDFEDLPNDLFSLSPAWDPANLGQLVFDGERGLMGLDLDLESIWELTKDANDHSPAYSPDGSQIAVSYWQNDHWEIHVMNADGTGRVRLTETSVQARLEQMVNGEMPSSYNNTAPAWSPDGRQIAFLTDRNGHWEIWLMSVDGSNQRPLLPEDVQAELNFQYHGMEEQMLSWQ